MGDRYPGSSGCAMPSPAGACLPGEQEVGGTHS